MSLVLGQEVFEVGFGVLDASNLIFVVDEVSNGGKQACQIEKLEHLTPSLGDRQRRRGLWEDQTRGGETWRAIGRTGGYEDEVVIVVVEEVREGAR